MKKRQIRSFRGKIVQFSISIFCTFLTCTSLLWNRYYYLHHLQFPLSQFPFHFSLSRPRSYDDSVTPFCGWVAAQLATERGTYISPKLADDLAFITARLINGSVRAQCKYPGYRRVREISPASLLLPPRSSLPFFNSVRWSSSPVKSDAEAHSDRGCPLF